MFKACQGSLDWTSQTGLPGIFFSIFGGVQIELQGNLKFTQLLRHAGERYVELSRFSITVREW